ncbi:MAG: hypothetical protein A2V66_17130 [Ignavibacteria bacterium RBG_13_36_8]|nr:MAG: hypothetical protein A2V66_17130 [Ignavibacteria bacterium RBG_13_36_8]
MELWTLADQQTNKAISQNLEYMFDDLQRETQENDVINLLGVEFYSEIMQSLQLEDEKFDTFLEGGIFYEGDITIHFRGLKYICCYLLYANYIRVSYIQDTFSGFMMNQPEGQQRISGKTLDSLANQYKQIAGTQYDLCKRYLVATGISTYFPNKARKSFKINAL